jgi:beta-xylosidase
MPYVTKLAVSEDGLTWERPHQNHLLKPTLPWEGVYNLAKAAVIRDDEVWLYYFGKKGATEMISLARSKDLVEWNKLGKPIFTHKDSRIPSTRAFPDCVLKHEDTWYMYYDVGVDYSQPNYPNYVIGIATSKDGITWTDSEKSPVLTGPDPKSKAWDCAVLQASVVKIGDWFFMLYSGSNGKKDDNGMSFGLARAKHPEGPWEKYPNNPVFSQTGKADDFDAVFLQHACPVQVGKQWRIYYNGWKKVPKSNNRPVGAEYAIGLAFAEE